MLELSPTLLLLVKLQGETQYHLVILFVPSCPKNASGWNWVSVGGTIRMCIHNLFRFEPTH